MARWHSMPFHFQTIHLGRSSTGRLLHLFLSPLPLKREIRLLRFPLEKRASPHVSTSVALQHLWPDSPNGVVGYPDLLGIQTCWKSKLVGNPNLLDIQPCWKSKPVGTPN
ncbi:hypothetical protein AVEN_108803-1 [Araneus ventricosus]|uniref:Uncharacterized protein n=1 Tax=Araneus ventricosus TaxID=182803 RepID=A0A4Y2CCX4_ARAVE|nr:hypothetical protein AVEN_108803-1 [Araneus ventricosus]